MRDILGELYFNHILFTAAVILGAFFLIFLLKLAINTLFTRIKGTVSRRNLLSKTSTARTFLGNLAEVLIFIVAGLIIFSRWGVDIAPILTGAGILGLAFSFGAQTLVKDLISGFLIVIEDQFNVGDYVRIGEHEGEVRKLTLRLTILEDKKGNLIYIPNSEIKTVYKIQSSAFR